ncbi:MAG: hypothetical protein ACOYNW_16280 [Undibacterium curvum]|uniref:hypothetical protein n=1 Tax=Undibacterium curvum TaxID=2762294 RepID=UPI003BE35C19
MSTIKIIAALFCALIVPTAFAEKKHPPADNKETSEVLLNFFRDPRNTQALVMEPYNIYQNGKYVDFGMTNKRGQIITKHRVPNTKQWFLLQMLVTSPILFTFDKNNKVAMHRYPNAGLIKPYPSCDTAYGLDCKGAGRYWIQLVGNDTNFPGEPYRLVMNGSTQEGVVSEEGYIFLSKETPQEFSDPIELELCSGYRFELVIGADMFKTTARSLPPTKTAQTLSCKNSQLSAYFQKTKMIHDGLPFLFGGWSDHISNQEKIQKKLAIEQEKIQAYENAAAKNTDPLSWLGPLPKTWSRDDLDKRLRAVLEAINEDVASDKNEGLLNFVCKTPAEVGPVPKMDAVDRYLEQVSLSMSDTPAKPDPATSTMKMIAAINDLHEAAKQGNWLARAQIYALLSPSPSLNYLNSSRLIQLMEWLQKQKIGALYALLGEDLAATGYYSNSPRGATAYDMFAAMHNSYPAQNSVGHHLKNSSNPAEVVIGEKMIACARNASPAYKKIFDAKSKNEEGN